MADSQTTPAQTDAVHFPPIRVTIPLLATLVYVSLLISGYDGFGLGLGDTLRPLPIYISLGILLIALQSDISRNRSIGRILYLYLTSGFALVYAGSAYFFNTSPNFIHRPALYFVINVFLVVVFLYDAVERRVSTARNPATQRWAGDPYGDLAADFAGLAILFGVSALLLDLLGPHHFWGTIFRQLPQVIEGNGQVPLTFLPGAFSTLESADVALALFSAGIGAFFVVIVGILSVIPALSPSREPQTPSGAAATHFVGQLAEIADPALDRVLLSLRLVLGPLVWFIPAFSIAAFSGAVSDYFHASFADQGGGIAGLFFPLSATAQSNIGPGFLAFLLGVLAIGTVVVAVAVVEHDRAVIVDTMRILGIAGRAIALVLAIAIYSLALVNAFAVYVNLTNGRPFQVGASGLVALAVGIIFTVVPLIFERVSSRSKVKVPVASR